MKKEIKLLVWTFKCPGCGKTKVCKADEVTQEGAKYMKAIRPDRCPKCGTPYSLDKYPSKG
ncbi:MAG: hypothetical protein ACE5IO_05310 [Thermoplasmata archaeon]